MNDFVTEILNNDHRKSTFDCGIKVLNDYFHNQAKQDVKRRLAACFILQAPDKSVRGYYTLSNASISSDVVPEKIKSKLPPAYKSIPATLVGRLAVDSRYQGQKLGELLLIDALKRAFYAIQNVDSMAVIVDPLNTNAENFYSRYGFIKLPGSGKMFLPMGTVVQLF